jgi:hypothetical protein
MGDGSNIDAVLDDLFQGATMPEVQDAAAACGAVSG